MKQYKKRRNIRFAVVAFAVISIVGSMWNKVTEKKASPNKYGIEKGEIITEISNGDTVDVICREDNKMLFYTYEVIQKNEKYKQLISYGMDNYFHYKSRKSSQQKDKQRKESLESSIAVMNAKNTMYKEMPRSPLCGVSVFADISKLRVNGQLVEKVIEYKDGDNIFYIWYFSDLSFDTDEKPIIEIKK